MTAQLQDSVRYLGEPYVLAAFSAGEPFVPTDAGYRPVMASTACWRGYVCGYAVEQDQLNLHELWINHQEGEPPITRRKQPPDLNGVVANRDEESYFGDWHFHDVGLRLKYTGGLLIGRDFVRGLYVHMGFHPAWKYRVVRELLFEDGCLVEARDVSAGMSQLRQRMQEELRPGPKTNSQQINDWIAGCFSRIYPPL